MKQCRVCGSREVTQTGSVEYIKGFSFSVYDCGACGCRLTGHKSEVHDWMHNSGVLSYYSDYKDYAAQCRYWFERGDKKSFEAFLSRNEKYKFIVDQVNIEPIESHILEVGSSRGYLTSYFILNNRKILGVDISAEAVADSRKHFGDHFVVSGDDRVSAKGPYDLIYHVGLIGCVEDPVGLTKELLQLVRPGGKLLFNAPNRQALHLRGQIWLDSAPPPDLVTLFSPGFWRAQFSSCAEVSERVEQLPGEGALAISMRQLFHRRWVPPKAKPMKAAGEGGHAWTQPVSRPWRLFERAVVGAARRTRLAQLAPKRPADFGIFVTMTRKEHWPDSTKGAQS